MNRSRKLIVSAALLLGALWPVAANACAVCFSGSPRIRIAFFNTTILLSLLPLGMIFGGLWYLRRSGKLRLSEEFTESDYSLPEPAEPAAQPVEFPADPAATSHA